MNILIIYETYSSSTETVSGIIAKELTEKGHTVNVARMKDTMDFMNEKHDLVIFATPSWFDRGQEGQPHMAFLQYMDEHTNDDFSSLSCAFVGLGDSSYAHFCLAIDTLEDFFTKRGAKNIGETLKLDNFYFNPEKETKKITVWIDSLPLS